MAFRDFTELDLGLATTLHFDSWSFNILDVASEDLWLRVDTLKVDTTKRAIEDLSVLNHHTVLPLGHDVHSSLLEVGEATVRDL